MCEINIYGFEFFSTHYGISCSIYNFLEILSSIPKWYFQARCVIYDSACMRVKGIIYSHLKIET